MWCAPQRRRISGSEEIFGESPQVAMTVTVVRHRRRTPVFSVLGARTVFSRKDYEVTPGHAGSVSGHARAGHDRTTPLWCCAHVGQVNAKNSAGRPM
jgi:hypothetical protein